MKKKLLPALSVGMAVLIVGSIAYAADRRKNTKSVHRLDDRVHGEEALKADMLYAFDQQDNKHSGHSDTKKAAAIERYDKYEADLLAEVAKKK